MVKKEQEVEEWQLRQRQAEAQLRGSVMELRRFTNISELVGLPVDATSLLSLLPTLRGFVQLLAQKFGRRKTDITVMTNLSERTLFMIPLK